MSWFGSASFDVYFIGDITDQFQQDSANSSIVQGAGRCSSAAYRNTSAVGGGPTIGVTTANSGGYAGWAYSPESFGVTSTFEVKAADGGVIMFYRVLSDGSVDVWTGPNTTLGDQIGATAAGFVSTGHYTHIGCEWNLTNGGGGFARVYINGLIQLNQSFSAFHDTQQWRALKWLPKGFIDDLYWGDAAGLAPHNGFLGDLHVQGQVVLTDAVGGGGFYHEWTPSTGVDHGALVDEIPPDDGTTYLSANTIGLRETFKWPSIIPASGSVFGHQYMPNLVKDLPGGRQFATLFRSGGADALGSSYGVAQTNFKYYIQAEALNPVTGVAWTVSTSNSVEAGGQIVG